MNKQIFLLTLMLLLQSCCQSVFSQRVVSQLPPIKDNTENIKSDVFNLLSSDNFTVESLLEPDATLINFDDVIIGDDNSVEIAPNRYNGVSFYSPYSNVSTWVTYFNRYSHPNSLIVGHICNTSLGTICSWHAIVIDFTQDSKDISFLWGRDTSYTGGTIEIYQGNNYQLVANVPVSLPNGWTTFSLNQYSQRIRRIILRHPAANTPNTNGHIFVDNFQFTPVTTASPVGYLDGVSITDPNGAYGWSVDPDNPSASNRVDCYVDTTTSAGFIGSTMANLPPPTIPQYPGNHGFRLPIPQRYRDGVQHRIYCYGIDITGGDSNTQLTNSPRTFRFNTPVGYLDGIDADGNAFGWSRDPDLPAQSNQIHFYVDGLAGAGGTFAGAVSADLPSPTVTPGNHSFRFYIPAQFRDGQQHTLYAYGIDLTGDQNTVLTGSPKTFNLSPVVQTMELIALPDSPITQNPQVLGGGKRIFPDKLTPDDQTDRTIVQVKAKLSRAIQGVNIYFEAFDLDEPTTDTLPIDKNNSSNGYDNRGLSFPGIYCSINPVNSCNAGPGGKYFATTNSNGEAVIYLSVNLASPGDNFTVAANTKEAELAQSDVVGINIKNNSNGRLYQIGENRTDMLTVWRRLNIEIDSMGVGQNNLGTAQPTFQTEVGYDSANLSIRNYIENGRFENGQMVVGNDYLEILKNTNRTLEVRSPFYPITVFTQFYTVYDDDDFNSNSSISGLNGDNGEDIVALDDSFNLMQPNDDTDCSDELCNVFAAAYIMPSYSWAIPYNTSDIPFVQNVASNLPDAIEQQVENGRYQSSGENDDFWVIYVQIDYQPVLSQDCDPNEENCVAAVNRGSIFDVNDVTQESEVPTGSNGSLIFIETMRDGNDSSNKFRIKAIPHEIGHQLGLRGEVPGFGLMSYSNELTFVDRHLNVIRWRRKSPGVPRN